MIVGAIQVELRLSQSGSLKDKRRVVRSILDRIRGKFNVAAAETSALDNYYLAVIGFACVSNSNRHVQQMLDEIVRFIETGCEAEIIRVTQIY